MKIAVIVWSLNVKGGSQRQALFLAKKLQEYGNEVTIYTAFYSPENCYGQLLKNKKVKFLFKSLPNKEEEFLYVPKFIKSIKILKSLVRKIKENKICKNLSELIDTDTEILNPHDQYTYKVSYYFKKQKAIPSIWMANDIPSRRWWIDKMKEICPRKTSFLKKLLYYLVDLYERRFIKTQDKIVVLDNLNKLALKKYFGLDSLIIRSGVDINQFENTKQKNLNKQRQKERIQVLMVGVLFPHRRFEDGIEAVKILKNRGYDVFLTIIGSDIYDRDYKAKLEDVVNKYNLNEIVNFLGAVSEENLRRTYCETDIFIFPNHLQTWGLVVFEAMACGIPVIVSASCGASEVLTNNKNALIVNPKSPIEIADNIEKLIKDERLWKKLSIEGRKFVEKNISWDAYAKNMENIFKLLIYHKI